MNILLNDKEKLECVVLTLIRDAAQPIGCGILSTALQGKGYNISEATVGRMLRDLDNAGYTEKAGFQGRLLSAQGNKRLVFLTNKEKSVQLSVELASALQSHTKAQLLEVLVARRAIECELAALAAGCGTAEQHAVLACILEQQRQAQLSGDTAQQDVAFHALVAEMAQNRVLKAAIELIRQDTQLSPVLEFIRQRVNSAVYIDHQKIAQAIIEQNADKARAAMADHINNLITDVEKYWEQISGN